MKALMIAASFCFTAPTFAQDTCGYCIELKNFLNPNMTVPNEADTNVIRMKLAKLANDGDETTFVHAKANPDSLFKSAHVCEGAVFELARQIASVIVPRTTIRVYYEGKPAGEDFSRPHLRICDGSLVPLQEYREKPFKEFFDREKRAFLGKIDDIAAGTAPVKIDERLKALLDDENGPLYKRKLEWVAKTAEQAAQLIARSPLPPRK